MKPEAGMFTRRQILTTVGTAVIGSVTTWGLYHCTPENPPRQAE